MKAAPACGAVSAWNVPTWLEHRDTAAGVTCALGGPAIKYTVAGAVVTVAHAAVMTHATCTPWGPGASPGSSEIVQFAPAAPLAWNQGTPSGPAHSPSAISSHGAPGPVRQIH